MVRALPRVAVTGVGLISALGRDSETTFARVAAAERGFSKVRLFDTSGMRTELGAEVTGLVSGPEAGSSIDRESRTDRLALLAAREALGQAGLGGRALEEVGLVVGASTGAMFEAEAHILQPRGPDAAARTARHLLTTPISATAVRLARSFGICGPTSTVCTACSSGAVALVQAAAWLKSGRSATVLAGAADGLCRMTFAGFNSLGALAPNGAQPFDRDRAGLTLGEGAAFLVLETEQAAQARGVRVIAWLDGWAVAAEAHHITQPDESGSTAASLLRRALSTASMSTSEIGFINAHGTGTLANDAMEASALAEVLGRSLASTPVAASKGQLGHTLAAAGAIEAALSVVALHEKVVLPCGGLSHEDPRLGALNLSKHTRSIESDTALACSYGFGGMGSVLALSAATRVAPEERDSPCQIFVSAATSIGARGRLRDAEHAVYAGSGESGPPARLNLDPLEALAPERSRRFDRLTALSAIAVDDALRTLPRGADDVGLCLGVAWFGIGRTVRFLQRLKERGSRGVNPGEFPHLVPSAATGNVSIYCGIRGPVATVASSATSAASALLFGVDLLGLGLAHHMIIGASAEHEPMLQEGDEDLCRSEGSACLVLSAATESSNNRPLACLDRVSIVFDLESGIAELPGPPVSERARVLLVSPHATTRLSLASTPWREVPTSNVSGVAGSHEAVGAFALNTAAGLIASGTADRALVVIPGERESYLALFSAPEAAR